MIRIQRSETADTRTCDYANVPQQQLLDASVRHIADVRRGLAFFQGMIAEAATTHDEDKVTDIAGFHANFLTGFKESDWLTRHYALNRHHLEAEGGVRDDVDLIDVLDFIADNVMAGMGRSGEVRSLDLDPDILVRAVHNTARKLADVVVVDDR